MQSFLADAMHWFNTSLNANIVLDIKIYLLGSYTATRRLDIFTEFFLWVIKWFVHYCRQASKIPSLNYFKNFLSQIHNDEKYFAIKYDKLDAHNRKWFLAVRNLNLNQDI